MRHIVRYIMLLVLLIELFLPVSVGAQSGNVWSDMMQISDDTTFAQGPSLVFDRTGGLHAFWSSRPVAYSDARFGITHSSILSGTWSSPQDIVLTPRNRDASIPRVAVDGNNNLHLFWVTSGLVGELYHSWAPANQAHFSTAWSAPELIDAAVYQHDVKSDPDGDLHLVYASQTDGICYVRVNTVTDTWSDPSCFTSGVLRDQEYDTKPSIALDDRGFLHVVWVISDYSPDSVLPYAGRAIYYARSLDGGVLWSDPMLIDGRESRAEDTRSQPEWPTIEVDAENRVHIVWIGQSMYRYHISSSDFGETWSQPQVAIPLGGYNNWMALAASNDGLLHFVTAFLNGLAYSSWDGERWSDVKEFPDTKGAHYVDARIAEDGSLHTVWQDHGGGSATEGHILYAFRGDPSAGLSDYSSVQVTPSAPAVPEIAQPDQSVAASATVPLVKDDHVSSVATTPGNTSGQSPLYALGLSVLSTSVVLLIVLIISLRRRRN